MGLETANTIYDLVRTNPPGEDFAYEGDNHLRLIKGSLLDTFLMDTLENRPAAGTEGRLFFSTDERIIYRDDGTEWAPFSGGAKGDTITGDTTLEAADHGSIIFVDTSSNDVTITLPEEATAGAGWWVIFIKTAADNSMIINDDAAVELDSFTPDEATVHVTTDATDWYLLWLSHLNTLAASHAARDRSTNQSVPSNTWTKVALDTEVYDIGDNFSDHKYTAPADGKYLICAAATSEDLPAGGDFRLKLYKNGVAFRSIVTTESHSSEEGYGAAVIADLVAGDFIELYVWEDDSRDLKGGSQFTWMQVARLA